MATDQNELRRKLAELNAGRPQNAVLPQSSLLDFRDARIKALQTAPGLEEQLNTISAGAKSKPSGALGTIGNAIFGNPLVRGVLTGMDVPRRVVISGIKETKDILDSDPNTRGSFTDFKSQVADPTFGFGRVVPMKGWTGRIVGLAGDVLLDPLTWATLGTNIPKKAITNLGRAESIALAEQVAKNAEQLGNLGLTKIADDMVKNIATSGKTMSTREFVGSEFLQGRTGAERLASAARKLGANDVEIADILKRGKLGLSKTTSELLGLNNYGIYFLGSRVKVPFSGAIAKGLASGLTKSRLGLVGLTPIGRLTTAATPGGTAANLSLRELRAAGRAGRELPAGLTPRMGVAVLDADLFARAQRNIAGRDGGLILQKVLEDPDVVAEQDVIYKFLDVGQGYQPANISPRQQRAVKKVRGALDELYSNIEQYGKFVAGGDKFEIAKKRTNFFPHKMTRAASDFLENSSSDRAVQIRQYLKVDHTNIGGSFESRQLERLVERGDQPVMWFGHQLTSEDMAKGADRLNELARAGGFKGDFFETNVNRALTSYLSNYAEGIGTIAFYQNLKEAGQDIGGEAVSRGLITKEALDAIIDRPTQLHNALNRAYADAVNAARQGTSDVEKIFKNELGTLQKTLKLSKEESAIVALGGPDADALLARTSATIGAAKQTQIQNVQEKLTAAIAGLDKAKTAATNKFARFYQEFQTSSFMLEEQRAIHNEIVKAIELKKVQFQNFADLLVRTSDLPPEEYIANLRTNLQLMDDLIESRATETGQTYAAFGARFAGDPVRDVSLEDINQALSDLGEYAVIGNKESSNAATALRDLAIYGRAGFGKKQTRPGITKGLGESNIAKWLNMTAPAVPLEDTPQMMAWIELRDSLGIGGRSINKERLGKLNITDIKETLARASSATTLDEFENTIDAVAWLMIRNQMSDSKFAQNLLQNPTNEFKQIKEMIEEYRNVRDIITYGKAQIGSIEYESLPATMQKNVDILKLWNETEDLRNKIIAGNEHILLVPDDARLTNVVVESFKDMFGGFKPTQIMKLNDINNVISHFESVGRMYPTDGLDLFIDNLKLYQNELKLGNPEAGKLSFGEFVLIMNEKFGDLTSKVAITDKRLPQKAAELYGGLTSTEPMRVRISRQLAKWRDELDEKTTQYNRLVTKLGQEEKEKLGFITDATNIKFDKKSQDLATAVRNFYINSESDFVMQKAAEVLQPAGRTLTPMGYAKLKNQIIEGFVQPTEVRLLQLRQAEELLKKIGQTVVTSNKSAEDMRIVLMSELRKSIDNPNEREVLQRVFPGLVAEIEVRRLSKNIPLFQVDKDYMDTLEQVARLEIEIFPESSIQVKGGARSMNMTEIPTKDGVAITETARRQLSQNLQSQGLKFNRIFAELSRTAPETHLKYIDNLLEKIAQKTEQTFGKFERVRGKLSKTTQEQIDLETLGNQVVGIRNIEERLLELRQSLSRRSNELNEERLTALAAETETRGQRLAAKRKATPPKQTAGLFSEEDLLSPISKTQQIANEKKLKLLRQQSRAYRASIKNRGEFYAITNSINKLISDALDDNISSTRPIKAFFAELFGGDEYAVPTLRGSEATRLSKAGTISMRTTRPQDSFFVKEIDLTQKFKDSLFGQLHSTNPEEAAAIRLKIEHAEMLRKNLETLRAKIDGLPEARKALQKAEKAFNEAKQAMGGDDVPLMEKLKYFTYFRFKQGELKVQREPRWNSAKREFVYEPTSKEATMPSLSSEETQLVNQYLTTKRAHDALLGTDDYLVALKEQNFYNIKRELAKYDLPNFEWLESAGTNGSFTIDKQGIQQIIFVLSDNPVIQKRNLINAPYGTSALTIDDFTIVKSDTFLPYRKDPFGENLPKLIERMSDTSQPELVFVNANNQQVQLRVARDAEGNSLGYLERQRQQPLSDFAVGQEPKPWFADPTTPGAMTARRLNEPYVYASIYDPAEENLSILNFESVADELNPDRQVVKTALNLRKPDGGGVVVNPENVWVKVSDTGGNPLQETTNRMVPAGAQTQIDQIINPTQYFRLSELAQSAPIPKRPMMYEGRPLAFTEAETDALFTDFATDEWRSKASYYVTDDRFKREVIRRQNMAKQQLAEIKNMESSDRKFYAFKQPGKRKVITSKQQRLAFEETTARMRDRYGEMLNEIDDFQYGKTVWDSRVSANKKVAWLDNYFQQTDSTREILSPASNDVGMLLSTEPTTTSLSNVLPNLPDGNSRRRLMAHLKQYEDGGGEAVLSEADAKIRRDLLQEKWLETDNSKIMQREQKLRIANEKVLKEKQNSIQAILTAYYKTQNDFKTSKVADALEAEAARNSARQNLVDEFSLDAETATQRQIVGATEKKLKETQAGLQAGPFVSDLPDRASRLEAARSQSKMYEKAQQRTKPQNISGKTAADFEKAQKQGVFKPTDIGEVDETIAFRDDLQKELAWVESIQSKESLVRGAALSGLGETKEQIKTLEGSLVQAEKAIAKELDKVNKNLKNMATFSNSYVKEETALERSRQAFDSATTSTSPEDVPVLMAKVKDYEDFLSRSAAMKETIRKNKVPKNASSQEVQNSIAAIKTEYDLFVDDATKMAGIATNPSITPAIQKVAANWIAVNLEYQKAVTALSDAQQMKLIADGLTRRTYLSPTGQKKEGAELQYGVGLNMIETDWVTTFDQGMVQLSKQFPTLQIAEPIAEFVKNVHRIETPAIARELNMFLGKYTRFFKAYATLSPGFHIRNAISNGFMLFAAGGDPKYLMEGLQLSKSLNEASQLGKNVEEWILGLPIEKQAKARIAVMASYASGGGNVADNLRQLYMSGRVINNPLTRASKGFGQWIEGHSRFMLAYDGAARGMDFGQSAARVQRFLVDYEDISTLDASLRQIIPFWMWTSRNLPMQIQNMWINPRAYQIYGSVKRNFRDDKEGDIVPAWMTEMGAWKLPFGQNVYAAPDIGFNRIESDIAQLRDPVRLLSNVNPLVRLPIELTGEKQLFSNKRFSKTPVEVTGGVAPAIQPLMELFGYGQTGADNRKFVNDKAYYALRNLIPLLGRAESLSPSTPTDPGAESSNPLFGLLGVPAKEITPKMQQSELLRRQFAMQELAKIFTTLNNPPEQP